MEVPVEAPQSSKPAEPTPEATPEDAPPPRGFRVGADVYLGTSNVPNERRLRDGVSDGFSAGTPSTLALSWANGRAGAGAQNALVTLGVGKNYNGTDEDFEHPIEAWYRRESKWSVTAGKYFVPFALQEWEYEAKWGVMAERGWGETALSTSLNWNRTTRRANLYTRLGHTFGRLEAGVSGAVGRGLSYGSRHDRGLGLDGSYTRDAWQWDVELLHLDGSLSSRFRSFYARLTRQGRVAPFIAFYEWRESGAPTSDEELGDFRSALGGVTLTLSDQLALEAALATTSEGHRWWLQLHYEFEPGA